MYGMFGVESLAVEIIDGENSLKKYLLQVFSTCNRYSDQIAYICIPVLWYTVYCIHMMVQKDRIFNSKI